MKVSIQPNMGVQCEFLQKNERYQGGTIIHSTFSLISFFFLFTFLYVCLYGRGGQIKNKDLCSYQLTLTNLSCIYYMCSHPKRLIGHAKKKCGMNCHIVSISLVFLKRLRLNTYNCVEFKPYFVFLIFDEKQCCIFF